MKNIFHIVTFIGFATALGILILIGFWLVYPYKTLVFNDSVFPVLNKTVKEGGFLQYTSNYCKYINMNAIVSRAFVNDLIYTVPLTTTSREVGCHTIKVGVPIPSELPPGTYHLENTYKYQVNPIREIEIKESTESFTVIP